MSWNYRVMKRKHVDCEELAIHEVYYDDDGNVTSWTDNKIALSTFIEGDGADTTLKEVFDMMGVALTKPVLDYETGEPVI